MEEAPVCGLETGGTRRDRSAGATVGIVVTAHSALGTPATLAITGHPAVCGITLARDLGDEAGHAPALRGVPCLLLDFVSPDAADAALTRLRAISDKFTFKETPTRIACSNGVPFALRLVRDFDEATIAAIDAYHSEATARYAAAQHEPTRHHPRRGRR